MSNFLLLFVFTELSAKCIAYVSGVNKELTFCSDVESMCFPVIGAAPNLVSFFEPSV